MRTAASAKDFAQLEDGNTLIGKPPTLSGGKVIFKGSGNILFCEEGVDLPNSTITFNGSNGLVMLGKSRHAYHLSLSVNNNCTACFNRDIYFNGTLNAILSEERTLLIGDGCLLSFGIWMRTADPHLVYDIETHNRLNYSKDIIVGDHVWLGQSALILKGSCIGSGSIVGAMSVVSGKTIPSNTSWAGNPVRQLRDGIFWEDSSVHAWTSENTKKHKTCKSNEHIYAQTADTLDAAQLCDGLQGLSAAERMNRLANISYDNASHNRFFVADSNGKPAATSKKPGFLGRKR